MTRDTTDDYQTALEAHRAYRELGRMLEALGLKNEAQAAYSERRRWWELHLKLIDSHEIAEG